MTSSPVLVLMVQAHDLYPRDLLLGVTTTKTLGSMVDPRERALSGKELAMEMNKKKRAGQPLLCSTGNDGTRWLYTVLHGAGWEITRDGELMARGPADAKSIQAGVEQFRMLTSSQPDAESESLCGQQRVMANSA
jgi:hypothetical protein